MYSSFSLPSQSPFSIFEVLFSSNGIILKYLLTFSNSCVILALPCSGDAALVSIHLSQPPHPTTNFH